MFCCCFFRRKGTNWNRRKPTQLTGHCYKHRTLLNILFALNTLFESVIMLDIFQTGMTDVRWWKWFMETSHIITVTGLKHSRPYYYQNCTSKHQAHLTHTHTHTHTRSCARTHTSTHIHVHIQEDKHTHTHTNTHRHRQTSTHIHAHIQEHTHTHTLSLSHWAAFLLVVVLEVIKQNDSQYIWLTADFVSGVCLSYLLKYQKLLVNVNPVNVWLKIMFVHPEVTLCGWWDVKIQELTHWPWPLSADIPSPRKCLLRLTFLRSSQTCYRIPPGWTWRWGGGGGVGRGEGGEGGGGGGGK